MNDTEEKKPADDGEKKPAEEANPYKDAILNLEKTHVPRETYDKVVKERQELIDSIAHGTAAAVPKKQPPRDVKTLATELQREGITNLEYAKLALELRERMIMDGEESPMLPRGLDKNGNVIELTTEIREKEENLAAALQDAVDAAEGSPSRFNAFFASQVRDDTIIRRR